MKKLLLSIFFLLDVFIGISQQIVGLDKYYYKSIDTCNVASNLLIGTSNINWDIKLIKVKTNTICQDSIFYSISYTVMIENVKKLFLIDCFIIDNNFCIVSTLSPRIKGRKFLLDFYLKQNQRIVFCMDGGRIYTIQ